jgi:hypothetical protein
MEEMNYRFGYKPLDMLSRNNGRALRLRASYYEEIKK